MAKGLIIIDDAQTFFTLTEICDICQVTPEFISSLIDYEIIYPDYTENREWIFNLSQLQRIKTVMRLQRDLEVNLAGAAVVLDLLDELEELRAQAQFWEKYF